MRSLAFLLLLTSASAQLGPGGATASFRGALPPLAVAAPSAEQLTAIQQRLTTLEKDYDTIKTERNSADAEIFLKAVRFALRFGEWYDKKPADNVKKANALLDEAAKRITSLQKKETPWRKATGQQVLGFRSHIDDSAQPYGVEVPEGLHFGEKFKPVPLWIWLHGRGDTSTDLNFVYSRLMAKKPGQFSPAGTIVIHPFGRYCNGWKSAGETDVMEAKADAVKNYNIDRDRIALAGFSMGGAGAWHMGAHFASLWACVHTGAGFVDVQRYTKLTPDKFPPVYEQKLWGVYDVPVCALNFKNVPLISYSGEQDSQRDSAEYMTEVLAKYGMSRPHLIGPGMGHKYHPEVIKDVQKQIEEAVAKGREEWPQHVVVQTRSLAYSKQHWLTITGMEQSWEEAIAEATLDKEKNVITVTTKNVANFSLILPRGKPKVIVNGQPTEGFVYGSGDVYWTWKKDTGMTKRPGLCGPMDDAFKARFIMVLPDGKSSHAAVDAWVAAESAHFLERWPSLMRGDVLVKRPQDITEEDTDNASLILWGTPESNSLIARMLTTKAMKKVLTWGKGIVSIGEAKYPDSTHVPLLCQPNPINPSHYVVFNTGLTFREAHDKTNSMQNPKLPDWSILDITVPPTKEAAGKVVAADFFDESWGVK